MPFSKVIDFEVLSLLGRYPCHSASTSFLRHLFVYLSCSPVERSAWTSVHVPGAEQISQFSGALVSLSGE